MTPKARLAASAAGTAWDVDALLASPRTRIVVCCGSGGVGKTTVAATLALRAAEAGRHAVVMTIDPARRLAQSLGLRELDNTPRPVAGVKTGGTRGRLDAMMLDMKRTFDEIVLTHATPAKAQQILDNPFYQALSASFAGTQEYMAMEKLGQLRAADTWDLIVVDTPPARSALDFLDAPHNLGAFLDGRLIRLLSGPARVGGRAYMKVVHAGLGVVTATMSRFLGGELLTDVQTFVGAMDSMFGGFRERADQTYRLLKAPGTAFVVVATPEPDAMREAEYFVQRLDDDAMPLAGLLVNRVTRVDGDARKLSADASLAAAERLATNKLATAAERALGAAVLQVHALRTGRSARQRELIDAFAAAHPRIPMREIASMIDDVHDLAGLRRIGAELA